MRLGEINSLTVLRKSDLGYMLSDGEEEVLMHFREATAELEDNTPVEVFLYSDKKNRVCASMLTPFITITKAGFVKVVNKIPGLGVFIGNNCSKDFLISKDYLPYNEAFWPNVDDELLCILKIKSGTTVLAKPLNRYEIDELGKDVTYAINELKQGVVARISEAGFGVATKDLKYVFVPKKMSRRDYRLGEAVEVTIIKAEEDDLLGSFLFQKEKMIDSDSELILKYLADHGGKMPFTAKSTSDEIEPAFHMSRKAFKRALGSLYKEEKITITEDECSLK